MILLNSKNETGFVVSLWNRIMEYFSGLDPNTVFSVLVSVGIFSLGWFLTVVYESVKERNRLKERARFLRGSIETILGSIERQQQEYSELSQEMLDLKKRFFHLTIATYLNFKFYSPNLIQDVHRFLQKHQSGSFQIIKSLNGTINGLEVQVDHSKENISKFSGNAKELEREWVSSLDLVFRYYDKLAEAIRGGLEVDEFRQGFSEILQKWAEDRDDQDTKYTFDKLVAPLLKLCEIHVPHIDAWAILPAVSQARYTYDNIVTNRKRYSELFSHDAEQIDKYKGTLSIILDLIDENLRWHRPILKFSNKDKSSFQRLLLNEKKNKESEIEQKPVE